MYGIMMYVREDYENAIRLIAKGVLKQSLSSKC